MEEELVLRAVYEEEIDGGCDGWNAGSNLGATNQDSDASSSSDEIKLTISIYCQLSELETTSQINNHIVRPRLLKRPTNLKIEGDFLHVTEHAEKFIEYLLEKRAELLRTPTTLRLEGEMDTMTETREQFIKYDKVGRPPLCKKFSNLHLEGKREIVTEKQDKFMPFEVTKRPPLRKKSTNLNLEGDLNLIPEYRRQYIDYKSLERPKLVLPTNNLKIGGLFESISGELNPNDKQRHPLIPFLRESDKRLDDVIDHRKIPTRASYSGESEQNYNRNKTYLNINSGKSGSHPNLNYMKRNISLERNMEMNPEYKNSYIDFYKHGRISPKVKSKRQSELNYMHGDSKMEIQPESSRSYINFPRQRPYVRKPEGHISNEGEGSLTPSPIPRPGRDNEYKVRSRDSSPTIITENTRVPCRRSNLSETPTIAEVPLLQSNRWSESADSDTAFLVLDEKVPNKRVATNNLYKEQKWMPSWNYPNK
ncbi:hypothetical protein NQ314_001590 [Rhamnusium bicolor]|uniref:Uncharacterized protein n=1 Tax=Rhamnusium bicolor TaxID=1586634 RepID=A0AAV8ZS90_9CUCU|nr:hypothetical protein NQ314_001590 [Rhamnusium bicolor]